MEKETYLPLPLNCSTVETYGILRFGRSLLGRRGGPAYHFLLPNYTRALTSFFAMNFIAGINKGI